MNILWDRIEPKIVVYTYIERWALLRINISFQSAMQQITVIFFSLKTKQNKINYRRKADCAKVLLTPSFLLYKRNVNCNCIKFDLISCATEIQLVEIPVF